MDIPKKPVRILKRVGREIGDARVMTHAAALAFYTALSLPPLLVLLVWALGALPGESQELLREQADQLIGQAGVEVVDSILDSADRSVGLTGISGIIGSLALLFAASGVFAQLQGALNVIWDVEPKPGAGLMGWLRKRLLSMGLVGVLAFLAAVSLGASTFVDAIVPRGGPEFLGRAANVLLSIAVFTMLFAAVFKLLPDVEMRWRDVWGGALFTAVLFSIGKWGIGAYLAAKGIGSDYGAAGSAIVVLAWVYFNGAIVFIGAEVTQAWLRENGRRLVPDEHAVREGS